MRRILSAAVCLLLCFGVFPGPVSAAAKNDRLIAQATPQSNGTISGTVRDQQGRPVGGAAVSVEGNGQSATATSGDNGTFSVSLPPGIYTINVSHGGFQTAQAEDVAVASGATVTVGISLAVANLQNLRVIGRTSANTANRFNATESSIAVLPPQEIAIRQSNNLTDVVGTLPGVTISHSFSATPNTNFVVRGAAVQTKVNIDGHPVSSGVFGTWNTNYAEGGIFQNIQVLKGPGLNGPTAGESAIGTVNLQTLDFSPRSTGSLQLGLDSYNGSFYRVNARANTMNGKVQIVAGKDFVGYNGPFDQWLDAYRVNTGTLSAITPGTYSVPTQSGLAQWQGDFSNRYSLEAELAKIRINFSSATAFTAGFLGLQGQYQPQGGSYATYYGGVTLNACQNPSSPPTGFSGGLQPTLDLCAPNATYGPPYAFGAIGTTVPGYSWFPNSFIQNNEPYFFGELRTTLKNDTFLLRPYTGLINRYISGAKENTYPGNGGGWYAVTSNANCQVTFASPTATAGAKGPCFGLNMMPNSASFVNDPSTPHIFATTNVAPATCSPSPPYTCFTTTTAQQNDGAWGYGTPFSQPELDRLNGYTFTWIHPVKDNIYNFSYDYNSDYTTAGTGDQSGPLAGCTLVIGSGATNAPGFPGYQPTCGLPFLPRSSISTPGTRIQKGDFSLTGQFQVLPQLQVQTGLYYTAYKANAQVENPATINTYVQPVPQPSGTPRPGNSGAAPVDLVTRIVQTGHFDPHLAIAWRPTRDVSVRAAAGSSITTPYASLISGFGSVTLPNAANNQTLEYTLPNVNLLPQTTVAYDVGADFRAGPNVFSVDAFDNTIHNVFLSSTQLISTSPLTTLTQQINGPIQRTYGLEFTAQNTPPLGFGYYFTTSLLRTYNDQLPLSVYGRNASFLVNGMQLFGYPYAKAYGELRFSGPNNTLLTLGGDYEGNNNSTYGPPYVLFNASARWDPIPGTTLQISAENLSNLSTGSALGRALNAQGNLQPTLTLVNGQLAYGSSRTVLQALPFRTIRFSLTEHL